MAITITNEMIQAKVNAYKARVLAVAEKLSKLDKPLRWTKCETPCESDYSFKGVGDWVGIYHGDSCREQVAAKCLSNWLVDAASSKEALLDLKNEIEEGEIVLDELEEQLAIYEKQEAETDEELNNFFA